MRHVLFKEAPTYQTAILIKTTALNKANLTTHYVDPLVSKGLQESDFIGFSLEYDANGKCPVSLIKKYLSNLLPALKSLGVNYLYVCDSGYFKVLTKQKKAEPHYGYVLPCAIDGYEDMQVILGTNYQGLFYNPDMQKKLDLSLDTLASSIDGTHQVLGEDVIHSESYPESFTDIQATLESLHQYESLTCDIEAFSLKFYEAGIGTIGFAWDQHNGVAFCVDYKHLQKTVTHAASSYHGGQKHNPEVKQLLREFFESYKGTLIWHNANYDVKVCIYELWMDHPLDTAGMIKGLNIMNQRVHDTKIITYLATNSCAGNKLSLKEQAHEFAGNYAQGDINDIRLIPKAKLLRYNLVDCLSTWFVFNKHYPTLVADQQEEIYTTLMLPSIKLLEHVELVGMPLDMEKVHEAEKELQDLADTYSKALFSCTTVQDYGKYLKAEAIVTDYDKRVAKAKNPSKIKPTDPDKYKDLVFNPNSGPQLQELIYNQMSYEVIDLTDTKQPATGGDTLAKLINYAKTEEHKIIFESLIGLSKVNKILTSFIPAFKGAWLKADGIYYLHGSFILGGTVSGRLSSKQPNLQNIPSGSKFAKLIKACFKAGKDWIFAGADFTALESKIDALTTKDPVKLSVFTDGYDSHSFNAYAYWPNKVPDIQKYLTQAKLEQKLFKVTYDSGLIEYLAEEDLPK